MRLFQPIGVLLALFGSACRSPQDKEKTMSSLTAVESRWDFCQLKGIAPDAQSRDLWSAETVQDQLQRLLDEPFMGRAPWSAYTVAYKKMTAERDLARCNSRLKSSDEIMDQMNHLLADIMTRSFVTLMRQCPTGSPDVPGFCPLVAKIKAENYDALSAAMASTGVYLSSHLALSVAAIAYSDDFWDASPFAETHRMGRPWSDVRAARLAQIKRFKPTFDRFNGFLANQLTTVATALKDADMVKGDGLNLVTGLSRLIPFRASLFGRIRDDAFAAAQRMIETHGPEDHPFIAIKAGRSNLAYLSFQKGGEAQAQLVAVESFAQQAVAGSTSLFVYRNLLGGKTWEELMKDEPTKKEMEKI